MTHDPDFGGDLHRGVPAEVISVLADTSRFDDYAGYPGALAVIVHADDDHFDQAIGETWTLVSPHGHRMNAICVAMSDSPLGGRERQFAVGSREHSLVDAGHGWRMEPNGHPAADDIDGLLLCSAARVRTPLGVELTFAVDQIFGPLLRDARQVAMVDLPEAPFATITRVVEDLTDENNGHTVVELTLPFDPWLTVGGVFRLRPRRGPALRLLS